MILLQLSQRAPLKFKAPRVVVDRTLKYATLDQLAGDWNAARTDLRLLLEKFDDSQIRKKVYRHVRAGRLNIQHALLFFREHIIHHTPQIKKLLNHNR